MRYLSRLELLGGLFVFAGVFSACSFVYDLSADQCEVNADCNALGGDFVGRECRAGVCIAGNQPTGGAGGMDAGGCSSTKECLADETIFEDTVCINRECVPLADAEAGCPLVVPSDPQQLRAVLGQSGEPIIFGTFGPVQQGVHTARTRNYDMALTEFYQDQSGLPGSGSTRRGLVGIVCETPDATADAVESRAKLERSMDHLVQTLKVPGVIPSLLPTDLQFVFERELQRDADNTPLFLSPFESDGTLLNLFDNSLLWHMLPGGDQIGLPYKPLLTRVLDSLALDEPARIAVVTTQDIRLLDDLRTVVVSDDKGIVFNGGPVEDSDSATFLEFLIRTTQGTGDLGDEVTALLEFKPHVIIALGADEFLTGIFTPLESQWNDATDTAPRPFYLFSPYHMGSPALTSLLPTNQLRQRSAGVTAAGASDRDLYNEYLGRFRATYASDMFPRYTDFENFYDPMYYLIYSAAAVAPSTARPTGADMARGMRKITDMNASQAFEVGPEDISNVLQALNSGPVRVDGTLGPPDFDDKGGRAVPGSVWCVNSSNAYRTDVLRFDKPTGELVLGTDPETGEQLEDLPCIADF